ncbi:MAG: TspO/MBR family protein [Erythrobacter sp.]|uniref:TspO/MBR family protein n=1 Tax=Erythrobacter sp. TaxID=1042 RepID=UPI003C717C8C
MNLIASKSQLRASFARWALLFVPLILLLGSLSGQLGSSDTAWFAGLRKPEIFPPSAVFGIAWSVLFVLIGLALAFVASAWGAHGRRLALGVFALHFIGTLAWTPVFFGLQEMRIALWVLVYVVVSLFVVVLLFGRVRKVAALLLLPYLGWVAFASVLNYEFIIANPAGGETRQAQAAVRAAL